MLLFAHAGIPVGAAWLWREIAVRKGSPGENWRVPEQERSNLAPSPPSDFPRGVSLVERVDYRFLLLGALLPDILDKPIGQVFFRAAFSNGRIFGHTLLFSVLIMAAGFYLYARRGGSTKGLWLSCGCLAHLCLDEMWSMPRTLLWPLYGWGFERFEGLELTHWVRDIFASLVTKPGVYVPETIGVLILFAFFLRLLQQRRLHSFLRTGMIG